MRALTLNLKPVNLFPNFIKEKSMFNIFGSPFVLNVNWRMWISEMNWRVCYLVNSGQVGERK